MSSAAFAEADMKLEPDIKASDDLALAEGFEMVFVNDHHGTNIREDVENQIVAPLMEALAPGRHYGFSFFHGDINDDGEDDVVLFLKAAGIQPPEGFPSTGAPMLVYVHEDGWKLALEGGAMGIGLRKGVNGTELALVQHDGFDVYSWQGSTLVKH